VPAVFEYRIQVTEAEIDGVGHVNNIEYMRWMQQAAVPILPLRDGRRKPIMNSDRAGSCGRTLLNIWCPLSRAMKSSSEHGSLI
jgi:hypothetical protein